MSDKAGDDKRAKQLRDFARKPFNKTCFDCNERVRRRAAVPAPLCRHRAVSAR